jgi:DNA-directed RNA polymerase subunit omega
MVDNRFALVHLATKRARQLTAGAKPLMDAPGNKEVVTALREIAGGYVKSQNAAPTEPAPEA